MKIDNQLLKTKKNICLACSGGMDSMALAHYLLKNNIPFSIAHCNFQLRSMVSDGDEEFVENFCMEHKIPFYSTRFDTKSLAKTNKNSIEIEARNLRYQFFEELTEKYEFDAILLAHHANDQAETILMRIITGTGMKGMKGISSYRSPNYYRPFLALTRDDITKYILANNIAYRVDSSNNDSAYTRNKIRNEILPKIAEINPSYLDSFLLISELGSEMEALFQHLYSSQKDEWDRTGSVDLSDIKSEKFIPLILFYILESHRPNRAEIRQIFTALSSFESKKIQCGRTWIEVKNGVIHLIDSSQYSIIKFHSIQEILDSNEWQAELAKKNFESGSIYFDLDKLNLPIIYRTHQSGDKIKPIGMNGNSKKISDIFQEKKWTLNQKYRRCILEDSQGDIIGIIGVTSAISTSINKDTKSIIKIRKKLD